MELEKEIEATIYDFKLNGMTPKRTAKRIMALIAEQNETESSKSKLNVGLDALFVEKGKQSQPHKISYEMKSCNIAIFLDVKTRFMRGFVMGGR